MYSYRKMVRMYNVELSDDGSKFELRFEVNGEIVESEVTYCFEDIMYFANENFSEWCEKYGVDTRCDSLEVNLNYRFS